MNTAFKKEDVEIVMATMNRNSLDFLIPMFPDCHFSEFSILIINQTQENNLLISNYPSVRVINSFEKGLSKSRNLALKNAVGRILLIADDDEIFKKDFDSIISNSYNKYPDAAVISFQVENFESELFRKYPKKTTTNPSQLDLFNIFSPEISINKAIVETSNTKFDTNFGLGSVFKMGEEAVFLMDLRSKNQQIVTELRVVAINPTITTTDKLNFIERYYIQGALLSRISMGSYFKGLFLKLFFDLKQNKLKINQILSASRSASRGRNDFYKLRNENNA